MKKKNFFPTCNNCLHFFSPLSLCLWSLPIVLFAVTHHEQLGREVGVAASAAAVATECENLRSRSHEFAKTMFPMTSVIRFGEILPPWQNVKKNFGHFERVHYVFVKI